MPLNDPFFVLAFYAFSRIEDAILEVSEHRSFLEKLNAKSRIYISEEGINGQMSIAREDAYLYIDWLHSRKPFENTEVKIHGWHEHVFPRLIVKYRKNLVGRDQPINLANRGRHMPPKEFKNLLRQETKDYLLLDVRNNYEWKAGHFKHAELPPCDNYREFEAYAEELKNKIDKDNTKVVMYCTGGIRCELYSSLLIEKGIKNVFQLEGGVIKYGLEEGSEHWEGKLFVFDDRLTVPISDEPATVVATCHHCGVSNDNYYNCANVDCNELFFCCPDCLQKMSGCCQESCRHASRIRPFQDQNPHKPFRRVHTYCLDNASR